MLDIVQLPLARRMWRIAKLFNTPLNDKRIQDLDIYDIEFYEYSYIADDPERLEQLKNHYYDPEFEEWLEEFDAEQEKKQAETKHSQPEKQIEEKPIQVEEKEDGEEYEEVSSSPTEITDWETDNG